jgi:hypothetical protein
MYYDFSRQILKARRYREQPERFQMVSDDIAIWIDHGVSYVLVRMEDGFWQCECSYALRSSFPCAHAQALERLLIEGLVWPKEGARPTSQAALFASESRTLMDEPVMSAI